MTLKGISMFKFFPIIFFIIFSAPISTMKKNEIIEYATPLKLCIQISSMEQIVDFFNNHRDDHNLSYTDKNNNNALHYVVRNNSNVEVDEIIHWLFEYEAQEINRYVNMTNKKKETPLHHAIKYGSQGFNTTNVIHILFEHEEICDYKLDLTICDKNGLTALALALSLGDPTIISALNDYVSEDHWSLALEILDKLAEVEDNIPTITTEKKKIRRRRYQCRKNRCRRKT